MWGANAGEKHSAWQVPAQAAGGSGSCICPASPLQACNGTVVGPLAALTHARPEARGRGPAQAGHDSSYCMPRLSVRAPRLVAAASWLQRGAWCAPASAPRRCYQPIATLLRTRRARRCRRLPACHTLHAIECMVAPPPPPPGQTTRALARSRPTHLLHLQLQAWLGAAPSLPEAPLGIRQATKTCKQHPSTGLCCAEPGARPRPSGRTHAALRPHRSSGRAGARTKATRLSKGNAQYEGSSARGCLWGWQARAAGERIDCMHASSEWISTYHGQSTSISTYHGTARHGAAAAATSVHAIAHVCSAPVA